MARARNKPPGRGGLFGSLANAADIVPAVKIAAPKAVAALDRQTARDLGIKPADVRRIRRQNAHAVQPQTTSAAPLTRERATDIAIQGRGSGLIDPTRTATDPAVVQHIRRENRTGPSPHGLAATALGPDLAGHLPGAYGGDHHPHEGFGVTHVGPVPIPSGVGGDLAMLIPGTFIRGGRAAVGTARVFRAGKYEARVAPAQSATGRAAERVVDKIRPVTSRVGIAKTEVEKAAQVDRELRKTAQGVHEGPVLALKKAAKHLTRSQEYALRVVAEGAPLHVRAGHHIDQIATGSKESALYHKAHLGLLERAGKYTETEVVPTYERMQWAEARGVPLHEVPTEITVLREDAPKKLKVALAKFQDVGVLREDILKELGRIDDARIAARAIAPARVLHGARWKTFEKIVEEQLHGSASRAELHAAIDDLVRDPEVAQALKQSLDGLARSAAERAGEPLDAGRLYSHLEGVRSGVAPDDLPPEISALYQGEIPTSPPVPRLRLRNPLAKKVYDLAAKGAAYRDWYQRAAKVVTQTAHDLSESLGVEIRPEKFAQIVAITSQGANPTFNLALAAKAVRDFYTTGGHVKSGYLYDASKVDRALRGENDWEGLKTNSYYANMLEDIDPELHQTLFGDEHAVTVDRHIASMLFGVDNPSKKQYAQAKALFTELGAKLEWKPKEVQAAAWVPWKAAGLRTTTERKALSKEMLAKGEIPAELLTGTDKAKKARAAFVAQQHEAGRRAEGFEANPLEHFIPSAGDAYEHGYGKWKGVLFQKLSSEEPTPRHASQVFAANAGNDLEGLPTTATYGGAKVEIHSNADAQRIAADYMQEAGLPYDPPRTYAQIDEERATAIADWYEQALHSPADPETAAAYSAMAQETLAQYQALVRAGYTFEFFPRDAGGKVIDPYPVSLRQAMLDLSENKHLYVYPTDDGFGTLTQSADHPLLGDSGVQWGGVTATHNDIFRAVHDFFGHFKEGVGFYADGEENAWRSHSAMYSSEARKAMTSETRGQNSWVNYGPHKDVNNGNINPNATALNTVYADQKAVLAPDWVVEEGATDGWSHSDEVARFGHQLQEDVGKRAQDMSSRIAGMGHLYGAGDEVTTKSGRKFKILRRADVKGEPGYRVEQIGGDNPGATYDIPESAIDNFGNAEPSDFLFQHEPEEPGPAAGFHEAAAEELKNYAALARDVAQTLPEDEWPAWVKNQMNDQFGVPRMQPIKWPDQTAGDTFPEDWLAQRHSSFQDPQTGEVVAGLDEPARWGIKGAVEFTPRNTSIIHLVHASDESTFAHEMAHHLLQFEINGNELRSSGLAKAIGAKLQNGKEIAEAHRAARRAFIPKSERQIPEPVYEVGREQQERFARMIETFVHRGQGPAPLEAAFKKLGPAFKEIYEHSDLPDIPPHVVPFLNKLFGYKKLVGGKIHGADDIVYDVAYAPYARGMPIRRLTRPHRATAAYIRRASGIFSGGRRSVMGGGPDDESLRKEFHASLLLSGFFKHDVVGPMVEKTMLASRMAGAFLARKTLLQVGEKLPQSVDDIAVKVDPTKNLKGEDSTKIKALWDKLQSVEDSGEKLGSKDLDGVTMDAIEAANHSLFEWTGSAADRLESQSMAKQIMESQEPIDNIVWVPKEFIDESGLIHVPSASALAQRGLSSNQKKLWHATGLGVDAMNDFVKASILYLNPAYVPVQFIGNMGMALFQQGAFMPRNLMRAVLLHRNLEAIDRVTIDHLMQHGIFASTPMFTGPGEFVKQTFGKWANAAADWLPRRAAWLHEAYATGLKDEDIAELLKQGRAGDEQALQKLHDITSQANTAMVDFDRMTPHERATLNRWIFFYPWLRGATHYTIRFGANHPVQAVAIALAVDHMLAASNEQLGQRPYANQLEIPVSTESLGFSVPFTNIGVGLDQIAGKHTWTQNGNPMEMSLRQFLTFSTPADLIQTGLSFAGVGDDRHAASNLVQNLTPVPYAAGVALFGKDPFTGKEVTPGLSTFLSQVAPSTQSPLVAKIRNLLRPINQKSIHPRTHENTLWSIFGGSMAPAPYNREIGESRVLEGKPLLERRTVEFTQDMVKAGLGQPTPDMIEDLQWATKLDQAIHNGMTPDQKLEVVLRIYNERYGTDLQATADTEGAAEHQYLVWSHLLSPQYDRYKSITDRLLGRVAAAQPVP